MKSKWIPVALLCVLFAIYTIDRSLLGVLARPIQRELGLDDVQLGILSAAIFWTYAICVPFAGWLGDRFNRARLIGWAAIGWSAMLIAAGFATGFGALLAFGSIAVCALQTLYGPSANALIAEIHDETRTLALSCHQAAYYTGWFLSGAATALILATRNSWRDVYFVLGGLGLAAGAAFLLLARRFVGGTTRTCRAPRAALPIARTLRAFFGCPTARLVAVCYVAEVFVGYGYSVWGPKFVGQKFGLTTAQAGTGVMFWHYAAAFVAILLAGGLTDRLVRRWPRARYLLSSAALLLSIPAILLFACATRLPLVWIGAALLGAFIGVIGANQFTLVFDVVPAACHSSAVSLLNVFAGLIGSLAPLALGALSQRHGVRGLGCGFASLCAVQLVALAALLVAFRFTAARDRLTKDPS